MAFRMGVANTVSESCRCYSDKAWARHAVYFRSNKDCGLHADYSYDAAVRSGIYVARQMTKTAHGQQDFTPAARARFILRNPLVYILGSPVTHTLLRGHRYPRSRFSLRYSSPLERCPHRR